jgi:hypothetical protein
MTKIGDVPEIRDLKKLLVSLTEQGLVKHWEIPFEDILTRLSAAILFLTPAANNFLPEIWQRLKVFPNLKYRPNDEKKLSILEWRLEFNNAEK